MTCVAALLAGLITGCSGGGSTGCERGESSPEAALLSFLAAAHSDDAAAAQQMLKPGATVDKDLFEQLHQDIESDALESLKLTNADQASTAYFFTVLSGKGELVGNFQVHELENKCYAVAWGNWDELDS